MNVVHLLAIENELFLNCKLRTLCLGTLDKLNFLKAFFFTATNGSNADLRAAVTKGGEGEEPPTGWKVF